jgi:hypothetical protein
MLGNNILKFLMLLSEDKVEMMTNHLKWKISVGSDQSTKSGCKGTYEVYKRHTNRQTKCVVRMGHLSL